MMFLFQLLPVPVLRPLMAPLTMQLKILHLNLCQCQMPSRSITPPVRGRKKALAQYSPGLSQSEENPWIAHGSQILVKYQAFRWTLLISRLLIILNFILIDSHLV